MKEKICIKPHHFMDIIKLYGSGIEKFVPDVKMGHDFYKIGNMIIERPNIKMKLTIEGDDICKPCFKYNGVCKDKINHIKNITSKNEYNQMLDKRLIELYNLNINKEYTAIELCNIYYNNSYYIYDVWKEENNDVVYRRHELFVTGAKKYINKVDI